MQASLILLNPLRLSSMPLVLEHKVVRLNEGTPNEDRSLLYTHIGMSTIERMT